MEAGALKTRDPAGAFLSLMGDAELRIAQEELQRLWRTSPLNRYFIPISKLPPVGPDPRSDSSSRVPRCYPKASSTSRAGRVLSTRIPQRSLVLIPRPTTRANSAAVVLRDALLCFPGVTSDATWESR
eukprot:s691_g5.t1